jgi:maltose O-acetyltransferase
MFENVVMRIRQLLVKSPRTGVRRAVNRVLGHPDYDWMRDVGVRLGERVYLADDVFVDLDFGWLITIEDDATIAPRAMLIAHDASTRKGIGYTRIGAVHVGKRAYIGAAALILPGVTIGDDAIIGAGSVVSRDVPPKAFAVGNPARALRSAEDYLSERRLMIDSDPIFGDVSNERQAEDWPAIRSRHRNMVLEHGRGWVR